MRGIRCVIKFEVHDQCLLLTEPYDGGLVTTFMINSLVKDIDIPISILYRTTNGPLHDGTLVKIMADLTALRGTLKAVAYEVDTDNVDPSGAVPAPYTGSPRLSFDCIIIREVFGASCRANSFEMEVSVDVTKDNGPPMHVDVRCSFHRNRTAYRTLPPLFTTQNVRIAGQILGWVTSEKIWVDVFAVDILGTPPPGVGRRLETRAKRAGSPIKGIGQDAIPRRGRTPSPVKSFAVPRRTPSPVKDLSSSLGTFTLRSPSPVKDEPLPNVDGLSTPSTPTKFIFFKPRVDDADAVLTSAEFSPEPAKVPRGVVDETNSIGPVANDGSSVSAIFSAPGVTHPVMDFNKTLDNGAKGIPMMGSVLNPASAPAQGDNDAIASYMKHLESSIASFGGTGPPTGTLYTSASFAATTSLGEPTGMSQGVLASFDAPATLREQASVTQGAQAPFDATVNIGESASAFQDPLASFNATGNIADTPHTQDDQARFKEFESQNARMVQLGAEQELIAKYQQDVALFNSWAAATGFVLDESEGRDAIVSGWEPSDPLPATPMASWSF